MAEKYSPILLMCEFTLSLNAIFTPFYFTIAPWIFSLIHSMIIISGPKVEWPEAQVNHVERCIYTCVINAAQH